MQKVIKVENVQIGNCLPLVAIGGVCAIESEELALQVGRKLKAIFTKLGVPFIFKASYDKANRSSIKSWRGLGFKEGLRILAKIKKELNVPVLTDVHEVSQVKDVAKVADILQIPAFLSRQTDLIIAAAKTKKVVNIKKGQFLSPWDCKNAIEKATASGNDNVLLTERGFTFGYNNLVVDMRSLEVLKGFGYPVVYDATHSLQLPGAHGNATGGLPQFIFPLARAATAVGIAAIFFETHPNPKKALSDGSNSLALDQVEEVWSKILAIDEVVKCK